MNLFGLDVSGLDVGLLVWRGRLLWWLVGALAAWWIYRRADRPEARPWRAVLLLAITGHAIAWFVTMFPLPNIYGVNGSLDRENHLGWVQVIVAGNSPIRSFQVNQIHFEPLWPNLVALASLYNPEHIGIVMQIAPLLVGVLFILSTAICLSKGLGGDADSRHEAAFAGFFALLLASAYADQTAPFRNPWALTFMLKPNHALGLAFTPVVLLAMSRAQTARSRILAAVLLHILGWIFIIHMAFVVSGFLVFVALSWLQKRPERVRDAWSVAAVVGLGLVLVSPYFYMLREFVGATSVAPRLGIPPQSAHTLDGTVRLGLVFPVACFGALSLARGVNVFGRILASQFVAAQINWQIFHVLGVLQLAKEMDEAYYWLRFVTALVAGIGFFRLGRVVAPRLARLAPRMAPRASSSAVMVPWLLLMAVPSALPGWWEPPTMDRYFSAGLRPQPARVLAPTAFLRAQTSPGDVVAGDRVYARYVAAFGARRVLLAESLNPPGDFADRVAVESALVSGEPKARIESGRIRYGIRYLLVTPAFLSAHPGASLERLRARPDLHQVYEQGTGVDRVTIFELVP